MQGLLSLMKPAAAVSVAEVNDVGSVFDLAQWPLLADGKSAFDRASLKKHKAVIFVNIASKCGLTKGHYVGLQKLFESHPGLQILGFPTNDFGQEHSDVCQRDAAAKTLTFPRFEPIHVNGADTHPIFKWLKLKSGVFGQPENGKHEVKLANIGWNFGKFLVTDNGTKVKYFGPKTNPEDLEPELKALGF